MTHVPHANNCIIWPSFPADRSIVDGTWPAKIRINSDRAGTSYTISSDLEPQPNHSLLKTDAQRARLTTQLLNANLSGNPAPEVTNDMIQLAKNAQSLRPDERAERLLRHIVEETPDIAIPASLIRRLDSRDASYDPLAFSALAWSESTTMREIEFLLEYLQGQDFVHLSSFGDFWDVTATVQGHAHIADQSTTTNSTQAFVAMWFHESMNAIYAQAIAPAIQSAGYQPYRVDQTDSLRKIDDEIIAQIRQSRFVVADFTHDDNDVRGSVYYEAGFAHGLNIPVIFTAREGTKPHFDTRQYPHIMWKTPNQLRTRLTNRILAVPELGCGPNATPPRRAGSRTAHDHYDLRPNPPRATPDTDRKSAARYPSTSASPQSGYLSLDETSEPRAPGSSHPSGEISQRLPSYLYR